MKKILIVVTCVLFTASVYGQEDKTITQRLEEKYGFACYHASDGGWYSIKKGDYHSTGNEGACDLRGREIIPPIWDDVTYRGTYYKVKKNGKVGIRGLHNEEILPLGRYDDILYYQMAEHNYCEVKIGLNVGAIDKQGNEVIPCEFDDISIHQIKQYGFAEVEKGGKKGVYDVQQKKEIIPCKYGRIYDWQLKDGNNCTVLKFEEEYGKNNPNNRVGIIDKDGKEILPCVYTGISIQSKYAIVSRDGEYWQYGLATNASYALYNLEEKSFKTDFKYGYLGGVVEGEEIIRYNIGGKVVSYTNSKPNIKGGKWGYLDLSGKEVIPAQYDTAEDYKDGIAQVSKNGITSIITNPIKGTKLKLADATSMIDVDSDIPQCNKSDENLFAFIFANENYTHLKGANWAINDGKVFAEYCKKTIGVPVQNVRYYEDATYGNIKSAVKKIRDIAEVFEGEAKIIIYFSGLGATDSKTKECYLLPSDASLESLNSTGYAVSELQKQLYELKTDYTLVILDVPFSNVDKANNPLSTNRAVRIAPKKIIPSGNVVICTGCNEDETAFSCDIFKHGVFTYALLKQLQNSKGKCPLRDVINNASKWVHKESLKLFDIIQSPQQVVSDDMKEKWNNILF